MNEYRVKMSENGRILIPAALRRQLHIEPGEELVIHVDDNELHLYSLKYSLKKAQNLVRKHAKNKSLINELKKMRKEDNTK